MREKRRRLARRKLASVCGRPSRRPRQPEGLRSRLDALFGFQVAVNNVVRVAVVEGAHDLLKEAPRLVFGHLSPPDDIVKQFAREVLDDHDDVARTRDDVVQFDDVRVAEEREVLDLAVDAVRHLGGRDLALADKLHGDFEAGLDVSGDWGVIPERRAGCQRTSTEAERLEGTRLGGEGEGDRNSRLTFPNEPVPSVAASKSRGQQSVQ